MPSRRRTLTWLAGTVLAPDALAQLSSSFPPVTHRPSPITPFAPVTPGYRLQFPRDAGSHPEFRIEWWYVTGWLQAEGQPLGFQVTFFRGRPGFHHDNPSTFTPRQVIVAHAALSDPRRGQLISAQRAARAVFELAGAAPDDTRVWIDDWKLERHEGGYRAAIADSALEIAQKREALENVLIPYRLGENIDMLTRAGFREVDVFFKWYNFAGIVAVK